jgi:hypothetical protein
VRAKRDRTRPRRGRSKHGRSGGDVWGTSKRPPCRSVPILACRRKEGGATTRHFLGFRRFASMRVAIRGALGSQRAEATGTGLSPARAASILRPGYNRDTSLSASDAFSFAELTPGGWAFESRPPRHVADFVQLCLLLENPHTSFASVRARSCPRASRRERDTNGMQARPSIGCAGPAGWHDARDVGRSDCADLPSPDVHTT